MRLLTSVTLATVLLLFSAACGSEGGEPGSKTSTESVKPTTSAPAPTTSEPDPPQAQYKLGDKAEFAGDDGSEFNVTIEDYKKNIPNDRAVESDQRVDALLIRACNVSFDDDPNGSDLGTITNPFNFKLVDGDDGEYEILDLSPSPAPQPQLDTFAVIGQGDCKKGWLAFAVPADVKLLTTTYAVDNGAVLATWNL